MHVFVHMHIEFETFQVLQQLAAHSSSTTMTATHNLLQPMKISGRICFGHANLKTAKIGLRVLELFLV